MTHALIFGCALSASVAVAITPPPTVTDRALGQSIRNEIDQIRARYVDGQISKPVANRNVATSFGRALSPGGLRFQREFSRGIHLDFMRDDISKIVNNALSGNRTNSHGFYRELKYINAAVTPESPFELVAANSRQRISDGRIVEFDGIFRDRPTGRSLAFESKDWGIRSRVDLEKAKEQIAKIATRAREEGVSRVAWVNRQTVPNQFIQELEEFGRSRDVGVYHRVSTGLSAVNRGQAQYIDDVLNHESKLIAQTSVRRVANRLPYIGTLAGGGFVIHKAYHWHSGRTTNRDMMIASGETLGGVFGAWIGFKSGAAAGGTIGSFFGPGPGTTIGGVLGGVTGLVIGGITGHFTGNTITEYAVDRFYYEKMSEEEREATIEALINHYSKVDR